MKPGDRTAMTVANAVTPPSVMRARIQGAEGAREKNVFERPPRGFGLDVCAA